MLFIAQFAQGQGVQSDILQMDAQRVAQLIDTANMPERSFVIRSTSQFWQDALDNRIGKFKRVQFSLVQLGYTQQTNNHLAIGANDGSLYPSVGLQQRLTLGVNLQWRYFSLHLQPEFVSAENLDPLPFKSDPNDGNYWAKYYLYIVNKIDNFSRMGKAPLQKYFPGQSSFRINTKTVSLGISTENIWWGPGIKNSLVLTNNAPGFLHVTLNSRKPIATPIGHFEFQAVAGILRNDTTIAPEDSLMRTIWADGIAKKSQVDRGFVGGIISWNPKWTPNLHIGVIGSNYFYKDSTIITKPSVLLMDSENKQNTGALGSVFIRYAMPKEKAEIYVEYGRADKLVSPFNLFGDTIPTGYTAGFRKIFTLGNNHKSYIQFTAEVTQLQLPDARLIFNSAGVYGIPRTKSWYTNPFIRQGYSNESQVMGASIGPGSNSETFGIAYINGLKRIGIQGERIAHNNDFYYYNYLSGTIGSGTSNKYWADMSLAFHVQYDYKQLLFSGFVNFTNSLNYHWVKLDGIGYADPSPLSDRKNTQASFTISYFFKRNAASLLHLPD